MKVDYEGQDMFNAIQKQKTNAWLLVWSDYRKVGSTQDFKLEKSSKILKISVKELKQVLEDTLYNAKLDMTKLYIFDDWNYVKETILPFIELDDEEGGLDELLRE